MRIGITFFVKADGDLGLFENGLRQNVIFLYRLLKQRHKVYLLNHGDGDLVTVPSFIDGADVVRRADNLDVVICMGAGLDQEALDFYRQTAKIVCYKGGNGGIISMEAVCNKPIRHDAEPYYDRTFYDCVWITPQHDRTYKAWCQTLYRCPVYIVPQVWDSLFIPDSYGYRPTSKFRIGVLDPNITVMKTAHYPVMVAEYGYKQAPELFKNLYVTNAIQLASDSHFSSFCGSMSIFKNGIATVEQRYKGVDFLRDHCDAVITHQWENALNYLYYEVLWGGYPLIHNSDLLMDYGYYYPDFQSEQGGKVLVNAMRTHNSQLVNYSRKNLPLFKSLQDLAKHEELLQLVVNT